MKKILSLILLITLLLSTLIIPVSAEEPAYEVVPAYTNVALGATHKYSQHWSGTVSRPENVVDGNISHQCTGLGNTLSFFNLKVASNAHLAKYLGIASSGNPYDFFNINGKLKKNAINETKYLAVIGYELTKASSIDMVRIYLDDVDEEGNPCTHMLDGLDIAVSETGADGSWIVIYSGEKINCEKKFDVYTDEKGNRTAYIEADTAHMENVKYFRIGITESSCRHDAFRYSTTNENWLWCRITEVELLDYTGLELTNGATWGPSENVSKGKASVVNPVNLFANNGKCQFPLMFDGILDNAVADNLKADYADKTDADGLHYVDGVLGDPVAKKQNNSYQNGTKRYDLNGNEAEKDATHKYLGYFDIDLKKVQYIDNIKVYLDALNFAGAKGNELLLNGMDILVSETGANGTWKMVYSVTELQTDPDGKYDLRDNAQKYSDGTNVQQAWIDIEFDITSARYVRVALTQCRGTTHRFRFAEIEVFGHDVILPLPPVEEVEEETGINSLMLFPLLMRHRQYETETTTTMFGLRVKHLLRSADSITFEKNGVKAVISADALKALNLAGSDKLVVTIADDQVTVKVNGKTVDAGEGITVTKG